MEKNDNFKVELENQYSILIKANEKKEYKRYLTLLIVLGVTFIAVLISLFFSFKAYSTTRSLNNENKVTTNVYTQTLTTTYNNGRTLSLTNIANRYELKNPKVVTITNEGNTPIVFDIKLGSIKSTMSSTNNLVYTITRDGNTSNQTALPLSDKVILKDITIKPSETITFILKARFTGVIEGNTNSYSANVIIAQHNNKADLLE